jgi:hypothetical protein
VADQLGPELRDEREQPGRVKNALLEYFGALRHPADSPVGKIVNNAYFVTFGKEGVTHVRPDEACATSD